MVLLFKKIKGIKETIDKFIEIISSTKSVVIIITPMTVPEILKVVSEIAYHKKSVKFLLTSSWDMSIYASIIEKMMKLGNIQFRQPSMAPEYFAILRDNEEICMVAHSENPDEIIGFWTNHPNFVKLYSQIIGPIFSANSRPIRGAKSEPAEEETLKPYFIFETKIAKNIKLKPKQLGDILIRLRILPNYVSFDTVEHPIEFDNALEDTRQDVTFHFMQKLTETDYSNIIIKKNIISFIIENEDQEYILKIYEFGHDQPTTEFTQKDKIGFCYLLIVEEEYSRAFGILAEIIDKDTKNFEAHKAFGFAFNQADHFEDALTYNKKASEMNPEDPEIWNNLGFTYLKLEKYQDAMESFNKAIELEPKMYNSFNHLGYTHYKLGNIEDAINNIKSSLEINSMYPNALLNLVEIYIDLNKLEDAMNYYEDYYDIEDGIYDCERAEFLLKKFLEKDPSNIDIFIYMGLNNTNMGEYDKAIEWYKKVLTLDPEDPIIWDNIGLNYEYKEDLANAKKAFEKAHELDPEDEEISAHLYEIIRLELQLKYDCNLVMTQLSTEYDHTYSKKELICCLLEGNAIQIRSANDTHEFWMNPQNQIRVNSTNKTWLKIVPDNLTLNEAAEILYQLYIDKIFYMYKARSEEDRQDFKKFSELKLIDGIGEKTAQRLENAGIDSIKKFLETPIQEIIKIEGIGKKSVEKFLQGAVDVKDNVLKDRDKELNDLIKLITNFYTCSSCGYKSHLSFKFCKQCGKELEKD